MPNLVNPYVFITPPLFSDLLGWYDAQDVLGNGTTPSSGSAVSSWVDKTSNARNASQSSGGAQPTYNGGQLNGNPGITFDGAADYLYLSADWTLPLQWTFFLYVQPSLSSQDGGIIIASISNDGGRAQDFRYQGNVLQLSLWNNNIATATVTPTTDPVIWSVRVDKSTTTVQFRQSGTNLTTSSSITSNDFLVGQIGALGSPGPPGGAFFQGNMYEILIYTGYLTDAQCAQVENYLDRKWGS